MARIVLCHVSQDAVAARDLGAHLLARGTTVSFDGEPDHDRAGRLSWMRQFDAVILIWSDASAASPGVIETATRMLKHNMLIPILAEGMAPGRVPLVFRKLTAYPIRDREAIVKTITRIAAAAATLKAAQAAAAPRREEPAPPRSGRRASAGGASGESLSARLAASQAALPSGRATGAPAGQPAQKPVRLSAAAEALMSGAPQARDPVPQREPVRAHRAGAMLPEVDMLVFAPENGGEPSEAAAHASVASGYGAPPDAEPAYAPPSPPAPLDPNGVLEAMMAHLFHRLPQHMWINGTDTIEIRLASRAMFELSGTTAVPADPAAPAIETMSISLYCPTGAIEVERQTETTQSVAGLTGAGSALEIGGGGRWEWLVRPLEVGQHSLLVKVSAVLRDQRGAPLAAALPEQEFVVLVSSPATDQARLDRFKSLVSRLSGRG